MKLESACNEGKQQWTAESPAFLLIPDSCLPLVRAEVG